MNSEATGLLGDSGVPKVYPSRWWMAVCLSFMTAVQSAVWLTFGPISDAATSFYNMDNVTIDPMGAYGPIGYLLFTIPVVWMMENVGLRKTMILTGALPMALGTAIRCFATGPDRVYLLHIGQFLNGITGVIGCISPAQLSQLWFPTNERATSTAITTLFNSFGSSIGFIAFPLQVGDGSGMMHMMYTWAALAGASLIAMCIYFPDAPPSPPSRSAAATKTLPFLVTLRQLFGCRDFWLLALACGIPNGFNGGMQTLISVVLTAAPWNYTDEVSFSAAASVLQSAAWLGMIASLIGVAAGFAIGPIADRMQRWWKAILIGLLTITAVSSLFFALIVFRIIPSGQPWMIFITYIPLCPALQAPMPPFIEFAADVAYPVQAGTTDGGIQFTYKFGTFIFQCIGFNPRVLNQNPAIIVWLLPASVVVSVLLLTLVRGDRARRHLDAPEEPSVVN
eukprot:TRINITY_DN3248_c0_g1_i1.p1 TRINITY_DN3248_c0_g1~~TRINITY_DN3248_c0_g1_i1.p1  ORF type:complete len:466 (-),score=141.36 TRINITY_DN3248_c0_g1_i1:149-1501(-)